MPSWSTRLQLNRQVCCLHVNQQQTQRQLEVVLQGCDLTEIHQQMMAPPGMLQVGWRLPAQQKSWTAAGSPTNSAAQSPRPPSRPGSSLDSGQLLPRSLSGHVPDLSPPRSPQDSQLLQRGHWASNSVAPRTAEDRLAALQELSSPELMRRALTSTSRARQQACLSPCSPVPPSLQQQVLDTLQMVSGRVCLPTGPACSSAALKPAAAGAGSPYRSEGSLPQDVSPSLLQPGNPARGLQQALLQNKQSTGGICSFSSA